MLESWVEKVVGVEIMSWVFVATILWVFGHTSEFALGVGSFGFYIKLKIADAHDMLVFCEVGYFGVFVFL
jgi:hypothetical protein